MRADTKADLLPHHDPAVYQFFLAMALCHTVQAKVDRKPKFNSPEITSQSGGDSFTLSPANFQYSTLPPVPTSWRLSNRLKISAWLSLALVKIFRI